MNDIQLQEPEEMLLQEGNESSFYIPNMSSGTIEGRVDNLKSVIRSSTKDIYSSLTFADLESEATLIFLDSREFNQADDEKKKAVLMCMSRMVKDRMYEPEDTQALYKVMSHPLAPKDGEVNPHYERFKCNIKEKTLQLISASVKNGDEETFTATMNSDLFKPHITKNLLTYSALSAFGLNSVEAANRAFDMIEKYQPTIYEDAFLGEKTKPQLQKGAETDTYKWQFLSQEKVLDKFDGKQINELVLINIGEVKKNNINVSKNNFINDNLDFLQGQEKHDYFLGAMRSKAIEPMKKMIVDGYRPEEKQLLRMNHELKNYETEKEEILTLLEKCKRYDRLQSNLAPKQTKTKKLKI